MLNGTIRVIQNKLTVVTRAVKACDDTLSHDTHHDICVMIDSIVINKCIAQL